MFKQKLFTKKLYCFAFGPNKSTLNYKNILNQI